MAIFVYVPIRIFFIFFLLTLLKIRNILCKAGLKMCQATHVGLDGTEIMVGTETFRGPGGPWALIFGAQTTQKRCGGLLATSVSSLCPVVIVVFCFLFVCFFARGDRRKRLEKEKTEKENEKEEETKQQEENIYALFHRHR